jgi:uncharacterized protein (DUF1501 family)
MNTSISRREFFKASAVAGAALATVSTATAAPIGKAKSCIFLMLTGGPSQLDTWDPKPDAPSDVRGPFSPIRTAVPGMHVSELFPKMAAMADKFSLIRTMHHEHAPIHENGFQLLNTGRRFGEGEWPWIGSVVDHLTSTGEYDPFRTTILPFGQPDTGVTMGQSYGGAWLRNCEPSMYSWDDDDATLIECCEQAAHSVYAGAKFVTIQPFDTVFDRTTWDCHADRGSLRSTLRDYRDTLAPEFDDSFTFLLDSLELNGLLNTTLVVAVGEFGRTPKLNCHGGRDHWANCWTAVVAGGGVQGGRIIGESDSIAGEPKDRPVHCSELVATIYHALGISNATTIPGPDGKPVRVVEAEPVLELF